VYPGWCIREAYSQVVYPGVVGRHIAQYTPCYTPREAYSPVYTPPGIPYGAHSPVYTLLVYPVHSPVYTLLVYPGIAQYTPLPGIPGLGENDEQSVSRFPCSEERMMRRVCPVLPCYLGETSAQSGSRSPCSESETSAQSGLLSSCLFGRMGITRRVWSPFFSEV